MILLPSATTPASLFPDVRFSVEWYDPRQGVHLMTGTVPEAGGGRGPPGDVDRDWAAIIRRLDR